VLLHTILPLNITLVFYPLQLLSDMFGFNRGSNVGSCLYLTMAIGYVQYLGFPWPVPAGLLMYWFFKPHINNSVTWYSGIQCAFMFPTQQITLTYLVRTYRVANWGVVLHLLCLAFHVSCVFPWCVGWIKLPNYVYGFGPLNPCNMSLYDFIMKSAHLEPVKVAIVLVMFISFIICICIHIHSIRDLICHYDDCVNDGLIWLDMITDNKYLAMKDKRVLEMSLGAQIYSCGEAL
jgi:hypothetical protein